MLQSRGASLAELGRTGPGRGGAGQGDRARPRLAAAYHHRGHAYRELGDLERATKDFDSAIEIEPLSNLSRCARAVTKLNLGEYESALRDLDAALELDPDNAGALHSRGVARGNLGKPADAIADFDRSLRLAPAMRRPSPPGGCP